MPHIVVMADNDTEGLGAVMWRERVRLSDLESDHFSTQLVERLKWAVSDAEDVASSRAAERQLVGAFSAN